MKNILFTVLSLLLLFNCGEPRGSTASTGDAIFHTTDPARLYFKNIRSSSYSSQTQKETQVEIYTLRNWPDASYGPYLRASIVDNWLNDEAYIDLLEVTDTVKWQQPYQIIWISKADTVTLSYERTDWDSQRRLASKLYKLLLRGGNGMIETNNGQRFPLFADESARRAFRITLKDYMKLVD